jgi:hypothetical protein
MDDGRPGKHGLRIGLRRHFHERPKAQWGDGGRQHKAGSETRSTILKPAIFVPDFEMMSAWQDIAFRKRRDAVMDDSRSALGGKSGTSPLGTDRLSIERKTSAFTSLR